MILYIVSHSNDIQPYSIGKVGLRRYLNHYLIPLNNSPERRMGCRPVHNIDLPRQIGRRKIIRQVCAGFQGQRLVGDDRQIEIGIGLCRPPPTFGARAKCPDFILRHMLLQNTPHNFPVILSAPV